jgi:hypothetical protein
MGEGRWFASANHRGEGPVRAVVCSFSRDVSGFLVLGGLTQHRELRDGQVQLVIGGFDDWVQSDLAWNPGPVKNCGDPSARLQGFAHPGEQAVQARVGDGCAFAHGNDLGFSTVDFELRHTQAWGAKAGSFEGERVSLHPFGQPARFVFGKADFAEFFWFGWADSWRGKARAGQDENGGQREQPARCCLVSKKCEQVCFHAVA